VSGDPADIGDAGEFVIGVEIEDRSELCGGLRVRRKFFDLWLKASGTSSPLKKETKYILEQEIRSGNDSNTT